MASPKPKNKLAPNVPRGVLFPNDEVASHLGEVLWSLGEKRKAKKVWREAIKKTPDSSYLLDVYKRFEL